MNQPTKKNELLISRSRWSAMLIICCGLLAAAGVFQIQAQPKQAAKGKQSPNFTGGTVTPVEIAKQPSIVSFRFGKGARTKWHSHSGGQIILVEEGIARNQNKGQPVQELKAGETVFVGPNVVHWHGASPTQEGVQYNVTRGDITWLGEVTDAEFSAAPGR